ncbi:MAG: tyrosine-protein phosphatase [Oscillospiraceae bacterium]|nr:tyrosine-protein phosphatase [Oscillospiraceae bacterium]
MISNFRDLGGLTTDSGRIIPCGMLYRSANLHQALPEELGGISTVIDLRTETERDRMPDRVPDHIAYYTIPIFDEATAGITREMTLSFVPDMVDLYRKMIVSCQSGIQEVLSIIFSHDFASGGVLWHCTAGKDRCGVITAYVLSALGVSKDTIMADYLKSNESCIPEAQEIMSQLTDKKLSEEELKGLWDAFIAKPEYLQSAFNEMHFDENSMFQDSIFALSL